MAASVLAEAEAPKMETIVISARPIIRALAVAPVRRGLRSAFWLASRPTIPLVREKIAPKKRSTGWPRNALISETPMKTSSTPAPSPIRPQLPSPASPATIDPAPTTTSRVPPRTRRLSVVSGSATSSRRAAIGGIRAARRAGRRAANAVTPMPIAKDQSTATASSGSRRG